MTEDNAQDQANVDQSRRQWLKGAAVLAGASVATTVVAKEMTTTQSPKQDKKQDKIENHYHETAHIRDYYDSL